VQPRRVETMRHRCSENGRPWHERVRIFNSETIDIDAVQCMTWQPVLSVQKLSTQAKLAKVTVGFYVGLSELFNQVYCHLN
jgi:hypothetical protein